jgi:heme A synthase
VALRDVQAMAVLMFAAFVMPVGDAILTAKANAPRSIVIRHSVIALVLLGAGLVGERPES